MTPAIQALHVAGNTPIGPVLHAVHEEAAVWACSVCGVVFSGARHTVLADFAAHVFKMRRRVNHHTRSRKRKLSKGDSNASRP